MIHERLSLVLILSVAAAGVGRAQSAYVDLAGSIPASNDAAAASAPGVWNSMNGPLPLVGIYGQPIALQVIDNDAWCGTFTCPMTGPAAALLGDALQGDCFSARTMTIRHLEPGTYRIHLYGYGSLPCAGVYMLGISAQFSPPGVGWVDIPSGPWSAPFHVNHAETIYTHATAGDIGMSFFAEGQMGLSAIQFERLTPEPVGFCFGTASACPCGPGAVGHGCPSSHDLSGALLTSTGSTDIAADTLVLHASGVSNSLMAIVQGATISNNGHGTPFGDGRLCVGAPLVRLVRKMGVNNALDYPLPGDPSISTLGFATSGATRAYQVWFRDSANFCTSATFNMTNAVAVVWY